MPAGDDGFIVFTCQVPWKHHCGTRTITNRGYCGFEEKIVVFKQQHLHEAKHIMSNNRWNSKRDIPMVDYPEDMQDKLNLHEDEIFAFTKDGCYPDKSDISQDLEDTAVAVVCEVLNWQFPTDWRKQREEWTLRRCKYEIFDLAGHDERKKLLKEHFSINKRMKYTTLPSSVTESARGEKEDGKQGGNVEDTKEENDPMSVEKPIGSDNQDRLSHLIGYLEAVGGTPEHGSDNHFQDEHHIPLPPLSGPLVSHDAEEEKKDDQYDQHAANDNDDHLRAFYGEEEEVVEDENDSTGDLFIGWD